MPENVPPMWHKKSFREPATRCEAGQMGCNQPCLAAGADSPFHLPSVPRHVPKMPYYSEPFMMRPGPVSSVLMPCLYLQIAVALYPKL